MAMYHHHRKGKAMPKLNKKEQVLEVLRNNPSTIDQLSKLVPDLPKNYASQLVFSLVRAGIVRIVAKEKQYNSKGGYRLINIYTLNDSFTVKEYKRRGKKQLHLGFKAIQVWTDCKGIENAHYGDDNLQNPNLDRDKRKALLLKKMPLFNLFNT